MALNFSKAAQLILFIIQQQFILRKWMDVVLVNIMLNIVLFGWKKLINFQKNHCHWYMSYRLNTANILFDLIMCIIMRS